MDRYLAEQLDTANIELATSMEFQRRAHHRADAVLRRPAESAVPSRGGGARPATGSNGLLGN